MQTLHICLTASTVNRAIFFHFLCKLEHMMLTETRVQEQAEESVHSEPGPGDITQREARQAAPTESQGRLHKSCLDISVTPVTVA